MDVLLVAATAAEVRFLTEALKFVPETRSGNACAVVGALKLELLLTGVGLTATAYRLGRRLGQQYYDLVLNLGLAGAYPGRASIGDVVHVTVEQFGDLGAEDGARFLDVFELGLQDKEEFPFIHGRLANPLETGTGVLGQLPRVSGLTVNTVHGEEHSIRRAVQRFQPDVETMEGAALFYTCICEKQPFAQVRAISNLVERRNRDRWDIPLALNNLRNFTLEWIEEQSA